MRQDWFSKREDDLPAPEDLMPLSQSLITPDLALAFNISDPHLTHAPPHHSYQPNFSAELDSPELSNPGPDEPARTLKRPRLVWTPQLHKKFVDAVAQLGIKNAVPKTIMQHMCVDGLTRENVASHLQKYRLYLKRVQSISGGPTAALPPSDSATDRLFASLPVPAHFLHPGRPGLDHYQHHYPQPQFRHFDNSLPSNGQFEHAFMRRSSQQMMRAPIHHSSNDPIYVPTYAEDLELAKGKKVLTLFPTGDD